MPRAIALLVSALAIIPTISAQTPRTEFDVVSIKRADPHATGSSMRTLPDGTSLMTKV